MSKADVGIGGQIRWLRETKRLTPSDLAQSTGLSLADYKDAEAGNRRFCARDLFAIAKALGIGLADILVRLQDQSAATGYRDRIRKRLA